jgi:hypothetical protein
MGIPPVTPMSALGQKPTYALQQAMSALPLKADVCGAVPVKIFCTCVRTTLNESQIDCDHQRHVADRYSHWHPDIPNRLHVGAICI